MSYPTLGGKGNLTPGGDPGDKGKGEKENPSKSRDTKEEEENNQVIQDQVRLATCGTARKRSVREGGTGRQDQGKEGAQRQGLTLDNNEELDKGFTQQDRKNLQVV